MILLQLSADFVAGEILAVAGGLGWGLYRMGRQWQRLVDTINNLPCRKGKCDKVEL